MPGILIDPPDRELRQRAIAINSYLPLELPADPRTADRWAFAGVQFVPYGCSVEVQETTGDPCLYTFQEGIAPQGYPDPVWFPAFSFRVAFQCSVLGYTAEEQKERLDVIWANEVSVVIAQQAMSGEWHPTGMNIQDEVVTTVSGPASDVKTTIAFVEDALADRIGNFKGMIHLTPGAFSVIAGDLERDGDRYFTHSGHIVVADAGYEGGAPESGAVNPGRTWIYGSSPVHFRYTTPDWTGYDWENWIKTHNDQIVREDGVALIAFEPCSVVAAEATYA